MITNHLDQSHSDHSAIEQILQTHKASQPEEMQIGARLLMKIYITIMEDALTALKSIIQFLKPSS
jgi:hypothetical protein